MNIKARAEAWLTGTGKAAIAWIRANWLTVAFAAAIPFLLAFSLLLIALGPVVDFLTKPFATPFWMHGRYKPFKDWDRTN